jgi:hypothetical protein
MSYTVYFNYVISPRNNIFVWENTIKNVICNVKKTFVYSDIWIIIIKIILSASYFINILFANNYIMPNYDNSRCRNKFLIFFVSELLTFFKIKSSVHIIIYHNKIIEYFLYIMA